MTRYDLSFGGRVTIKAAAHHETLGLMLLAAVTPTVLSDGREVGVLSSVDVDILVVRVDAAAAEAIVERLRDLNGFEADPDVRQN